MENVVLTVHLILALLLIVVVLLQRSEGGGLGIGGGGGNVMSGRQAANAMTRATWLLAAAFLATSITLTVLAARGVGGTSVMDQIGMTQPATTDLPGLPGYAPPPPAQTGTTSGEGLSLPPAVEAPATPAPAPTEAPAPALPAGSAPAAPAAN